MITIMVRKKKAFYLFSSKNLTSSSVCVCVSKSFIFARCHYTKPKNFMQTRHISKQQSFRKWRTLARKLYTFKYTQIFDTRYRKLL